MAQPAPRALPDPDSGEFDLSRIFIAREDQLDLFNIKLTRWKNSILNASPGVNTSMAIAPSPTNRLQSLLVLLYGRSGFGKSTPLGRYQNRALEEKPPITVSAIVDWESAIEGKRTLFNPPPGQEPVRQTFAAKIRGLA